MSVRDGLLTLLTLGPAYGLQLHAELLDRAAHRRQINVGQIYSTLERLRERGLVEAAGSTDDGLPLHALTDEGRDQALAWLNGDGASPEEDWNDILDRILLASSLSEADLAAVLGAYTRALATAHQNSTGDDDDHPQRRFASQVELVRGDALRRLITAAHDEFSASGGIPAVRGFALERPRRGRRAAARDETGEGAVV